MVLWRISGHDDLVGLGGEKADGRWHSAARGKRIVYLSEHPALALVEVLANLKGDPRLFPDKYRLMKIAVPEDIVRGVVEPESLPPESLPADWREKPHETQTIGDTWLSRSTSALLAVPSAPSPESWNYLFNPLHSEAANFSIVWTRSIEYDKRLFHLR